MDEHTTFTTKLRKATKAVFCHHSIYGQLAGWHGFAAFSTGKPEIYVPMAVLYAVMALRP